MNKRPLVSIIMNCFNSDKYLENAINSIYDQTYIHWEIIFWNNKSDDKSEIIAKSYDKKLKYFESEEFLNLGEARKKACEKASGKYLAFLDCDDTWMNDKLEKQINIYENNRDLGFVYGKSVYYSELKNKIINRQVKLFEGMVFDELIKYNFVSFASAMIDRNKYFEIGGFPSHLKHSTDYWVFLKLANLYPVKATTSDCCTIRLHDSNLTNKLYLTGVKESIEVLETFPPSRKIDNAIKRMYSRIGFKFFTQIKPIKFIKIIIKHNLFTTMLVMIFEKFQMKLKIF